VPALSSLYQISFASPGRLIPYAIAAAFSLGGCVTDQGSQSSGVSHGPADLFSIADADHNGKLSRDEVSDFLAYKVLQEFDTNRDGRLTEAEWTRGDARRVHDFEARDENRDGVVTQEEAITYGRRAGGGVGLIRKADKDRDGKVSRAELTAFLGNS